MSRPTVYPYLREPSNGQRIVARFVEEEALEADIAALVAARGGRFYHTRDSRRSPFGWPDVALWTPARPNTLILSELKRDEYHKPRWTDDQLAWRRILEDCTTLEYYAWGPLHLSTGTIDWTLEGATL